MNDQDNDICEVALNVLLAEGVDLPTALEASRRSAGEEGGAVNQGCLVATVIGALVIALWLWF